MRKEREITIKLIKNKNNNIRILAEYFARKYSEEIIKKQNIKS